MVHNLHRRAHKGVAFCVELVKLGEAADRVWQNGYLVVTYVEFEQRGEEANGVR